MTDEASLGKVVLAARQSRGLTQAELAQRVGTNQQTVDKIEKGIIKHSRYFPRLEVELGITLTQSLHRATTQSTLPDTRSEARNLPVHASAQGGAGELIVSTDPVDWVIRPAPLANVARGYGIIVVGESMVPEYEPGDTALINPHLPPLGGYTCVFYAEGQHGEARATIKRLVRVSEASWHVLQWNPAKGEKTEFTLSRKEWSKCHRCVGKYSK